MLNHERHRQRTIRKRYARRADAEAARDCSQRAVQRHIAARADKVAFATLAADDFEVARTVQARSLQWGQVCFEQPLRAPLGFVGADFIIDAGEMSHYIEKIRRAHGEEARRGAAGSREHQPPTMAGTPIMSACGSNDLTTPPPSPPGCA